MDTYCIDKSNSIELQTAINSMFRWYRDAARCYVYMTDLSKVEDDGKEEEQGKESWRASFRNSRWFTRGWTLQELIAPKVVEFYFKEGVFLGDKQSLESMIRDITRIPVNALRGTVLSEFTMAERESWIRSRVRGGHGLLDARHIQRLLASHLRRGTGRGTEATARTSSQSNQGYVHSAARVTCPVSRAI